MKKFNLMLLFCLVFVSNSRAEQFDKVNYGPFGNLTIYKPTTTPKSFVLFISGDGGWNQGVVDMAKNIVNQGAMVVGVNILTYYKNIKKQNQKCYYPAGDFENLSFNSNKKIILAIYFHLHI